MSDDGQRRAAAIVFLPPEARREALLELADAIDDLYYAAKVLRGAGLVNEAEKCAEKALEIRLLAHLIREGAKRPS